MLSCHKLKSAFLASYAVIYVFDSDKLIGLGRALCELGITNICYFVCRKAIRDGNTLSLLPLVCRFDYGVPE